MKKSVAKLYQYQVKDAVFLYRFRCLLSRYRCRPTMAVRLKLNLQTAFLFDPLVSLDPLGRHEALRN
jgi:hypothetical protein